MKQILVIVGFLQCTFTWLKSCLLALISDYVFLFLGIGPAVLKLPKRIQSRGQKLLRHVHHLRLIKMLSVMR